MTILDARCRYFLERPVTSTQDAVLRTIPGVRQSRSGPPWVEAGYDSYWIVEDLLRRWRVNYRVRAPEVQHPRPWNGDAEDELKQRIVDSDVRGWLVGVEPGPWELLPFQREAIWFALERDGSGLIRAEAGAGKTAMACVVLGLSSPGPALVVTKPGTPVPQWCREVERFIETTAYELRPPSKRRKKDGTLQEYIERRQEAGERPVVICGWATLRVCVDELCSVSWSQVVYDESHYAKSSQRKRWLKVDGEMQSLSKGTQSDAAWEVANRARHRLCTTATPIPDRRRDLWGQFSLISPDSWGMTRTRFALRYCAGHSGDYGFDDSGTSNTSELERRMGVFFHDIPKEVSHSQLPPCRLEACYIPVEKQDKPATGFKVAMRSLGKASANGDEAAASELRELSLEEAATRKRTAVCEVVEDYANEGRVLLFTGRHRDCWELADKLTKRFRKAKATKHIKILCGVEKTEEGYELCSRKKRQQILEEYQATESCILVGTGQAWGTSVDGLQCTDLLGVVMLPWSPGDLEQWMGRVTRLGQDRPVTIMLFVAEQTIDDRVSALLLEKAPDAVRLGGNKTMQKASDAMLGLNDPEGERKLIEKILAGPPQEFVW